MKISDFLRQLRERNSLLFYAGIINLFLCAAFLSLSLFDQREVMGINTWIKPAKFSLSFLIFLWTFAWLLHYMPNKKTVRWISIIFFVAMVMEIGSIALQAARGVQSHYNVSTRFDGVIFQIMGIFILVNTLLVIYILIQFCKSSILLPSQYRLPVRAGLILFILGAISGGMMVARTAHTVGMPDGGEGLIFLNWSVDAGDLRVAHFFTLHALQFIPLILLLISKFFRINNIVTISVVCFYTAICILLHIQALNEKPFLPL